MNIIFLTIWAIGAVTNMLCWHRINISYAAKEYVGIEPTESEQAINFYGPTLWPALLLSTIWFIVWPFLFAIYLCVLCSDKMRFGQMYDRYRERCIKRMIFRLNEKAVSEKILDGGSYRSSPTEF